ncbi:hypothetical protein HOF67_02835 [Candidatus Peregrinibacteria bacterium]|jgi:hypothetical protein|nr:hypothetical protein [Candidatus Peregrinibacteria bacterium]
MKALNSSKTSGNFHEDPESWEKDMKKGVADGNPILLKARGDYHVLKSHLSLLDHQIHDRDALIFNFHGEVVPFVAQAVRQGILDQEDPGNNLGLLLDAHVDADDIGHVFRAFGGRTVCAAETRRLVRKYLSASTEEEVLEMFVELVRYVSTDTVTFIHGLQEQVSQLTAVIRPADTVLSDNLFHVRPMPASAYTGLDNGVETKDPMAELLMGIRENIVWLIDCDFFQTTSEWKGMRKAKKEKNRQDNEKYLIEGLSGELWPRMGSSLYTLSYDKMFCEDPVRAIRLFMNKFYKKLRTELEL